MKKRQSTLENFIYYLLFLKKNSCTNSTNKLELLRKNIQIQRNNNCPTKLFLSDSINLTTKTIHHSSTDFSGKNLRNDDYFLVITNAVRTLPIHSLNVIPSATRNLLSNVELIIYN